MIKTFETSNHDKEVATIETKDPVANAKSFIHAYYYRPELTVRHVADHAGVSPPHLSVLFRKRHQTTVRQTIVATRLKKARELLQRGRHSVKEVSFLTGWNNPLYFSKCFKKAFGYSPSTTLEMRCEEYQ